MKLFLTSTGLPTETRRYFLDMNGKNPADTTVVFIPTAGDPYDDKWFVEKSLNELKDLGFKIKIVDLKDDPAAVKKELVDSDVIYPSGGNTYYLLHWVRQSGLDKYLKDFLEEGRIYLGGSASSIIVGPDIAIAGWKGGDTNNANLTDLSGLNIVPFVVYPHFQPKHQSVIDSHKTQVNYDIIPISDTQAVIYQDGSWKIVGS